LKTRAVAVSVALGVAATVAALAVGGFAWVALSAGVVVLGAGLAAASAQRGVGAAVATGACGLFVLLLATSVLLTWAFGCGDDVTGDEGTRFQGHCDWLNALETPTPDLLLAFLVAAPAFTLGGGIITIRTGHYRYLAVTTAIALAGVLALGLPFYVR